MNISGIRTYAGFYDYNTIKINEVRSQQIQDAKSTESNLPAVSTTSQQEESTTVTAQTMNQGPDQGAAEYAQQYQPDATYDLKGSDSEISNLDVEKALSDMKKDQVLQQYQFFIGESNAVAANGLNQNRANENFSL